MNPRSPSRPSTPVHRRRAVARAAWLAVLALVTAIPAQVPPHYPMPGWPLQPPPSASQWVGGESAQQPGLQQQTLVQPRLGPSQADALGAGGMLMMPQNQGFAPSLRGPYRQGWQGMESALPRFSGFPSPQLLGTSGFGTGLGNVPGTHPPRMPPPLASPARRDRWPTWLGLGADQKDAPRIDSRAILVRTADRVWVRDVGEPAFVPVPFWDKARVLQTGVMLSVLGQGQFALLLHDGGGLMASGATELTLGTLDETNADLQFRRITRLRGSAQSRLVRLRLPGGVTVEFREAKVSILADETRAKISHHDGAPIRVLGRHGVTELQPGHAIDVLLADGAEPPIVTALQTEGGVDARREGRALFADGRGNGGTVSWYGVRVTVPPGQTAKFDPLGGARFPEAAPVQPASRPMSPAAPVLPASRPTTATQPDRQK